MDNFHTQLKVTRKYKFLLLNTHEIKYPLRIRNSQEILPYNQIKERKYSSNIKKHLNRSTKIQSSREYVSSRISERMDCFTQEEEYLVVKTAYMHSTKIGKMVIPTSYSLHLFQRTLFTSVRSFQFCCVASDELFNSSHDVVLPGRKHQQCGFTLFSNSLPAVAIQTAQFILPVIGRCDQSQSGTIFMNETHFMLCESVAE